MKSLTFLLFNARRAPKPSDDCAIQLQLLPTRALRAMMGFRNAAAFSYSRVCVLRLLNFHHERASSISRSPCLMPCCSKMFTPTRNDHLGSKGMTFAEIFINPKTERLHPCCSSGSDRAGFKLGL
jgi:hypothetical protein